jgi:AcrR family transcriptional regulator
VIEPEIATDPGPAVRSGRAAAMPADQRRSMIVAAALPLLLEHGDRVTTRQIAEAAGVAEGTIFRAFTDKDEVIVAVVEAALDPAPLDRALDEIDPALDLEAALAEAIEIMQRRIIDIWQLVSKLGARYHDTTRRRVADVEALVRIFASHRDRITEPPAKSARLLRALTLATTHPTLVDTPLSPSEIVELFLHGVGIAKAGRA